MAAILIINKMSPPQKILLRSVCNMPCPFYKLLPIFLTSGMHIRHTFYYRLLESMNKEKRQGLQFTIFLLSRFFMKCLFGHWVVNLEKPSPRLQKVVSITSQTRKGLQKIPFPSSTLLVQDHSRKGHTLSLIILYR